MGFRFRKSFKVVPGVRLNVSKSGLGASFGGKGFRYGVGPRGSRVNVGIPGTGIGFQETRGTGKKRRRKRTAEEQEEVENAATLSLYGKQTNAVGCAFLLTILVGFAYPVLFLVALGIAVYNILSKKTKSIRKFNEGIDDFNREKYQDAVGKFNAALELNPQNIRCHQLLTVIYGDMLEDYENAIKHAELLMQAQPNDLAAKGALVSVYFEGGRYVDTIRLLQQSELLQLESLGEQMRLMLGRAFLENGDADAAIANFEQGPVEVRKRIDDTVQEYRYWLGVALMKKGDKERARTLLKKVYAEDIAFRDVAVHLKSLESA